MTTRTAKRLMRVRGSPKLTFHPTRWHYDFVRGANKKSYGLHVNIFQLCLIVYGVSSSPDESAPATSTPVRGGKRKEAPSGMFARSLMFARVSRCVD